MDDDPMLSRPVAAEDRRAQTLEQHHARTESCAGQAAGGTAAGGTPGAWPWAGGSIMVIAAGHLAIGAVRHRGALGDMLRDGWTGTLMNDGLTPEAASRRQRAFWFEVTGVALAILGQQTAQLERRGVRPPRSTGTALAAVAVLGGAAVPASGFWALLLPAGLIAGRRPAVGARAPRPSRQAFTGTSTSGG